MGTSNWQNIPYVVDVLMKIEPRRVLDVGVGFGRWGMVLREFGEVWFGRIHPESWELRIEGIEAFPANVTPYHPHFYDEIHQGDASEIMEKLDGGWDLVLFGDVLEHFEKAEGRRLLGLALAEADYVIVNLPLGEHWEQGEAYGNPYEAHLSHWDEADFEGWPVVRQRLFDDYVGRPFGVFVLSSEDPRGLARSLFSEDARAEWEAAHGPPSVARRARSLAGRAVRKARAVAAERRQARAREADLDGAVLEAAAGGALAVAPEGWLGVGASTRRLFDHTLVLPGELRDPWQVAGDLADAGVDHLVLSGVTTDLLAVARSLRAARPGARVDVLWHGNYLQAREDYAWDMLQAVLAAARDGLVHTVGVVKAGMEQWLAGRGVRAALVLNYVPDIPAGPSTPDPGGPHLGIWVAAEGYRKLPYAMLAAASMIDGAVVHATGLSPRAQSFAEVAGLDFEPERLQAPEELPARIRRTHLTLYVTQSESAPMLPLESLAAGVPCLVGPVSHYFEDDPDLHSRLVVPYPDRADVIADHIRVALDQRAEIVAGYRAWAPAYNERARESVRRFLS